MIKKIFLPLASVFLVYRSVELVKYLNATPPAQFNALAIIVFSFVLNLFVTGIFAFLGFAFLTSRILPDTYYKVKNAQHLAFMYKWLGVAHFKRLLLAFFWGKEKNRKKYFSGTQSGLNDFDTQTRQSEFGHLAAFIAIGGISIRILAEGHLLIFYITSLVNVIGNLYPIILQRHHRMLIERLKRLSDRQKSPA